jgi:hypothetical protein
MSWQGRISTSIFLISLLTWPHLFAQVKAIERPDSSATRISKVDTVAPKAQINVSDLPKIAEGIEKPIAAAIVAGIFALIGGFFGAYFTRKTQHQNWLLEKRAEIFADFLRTFAKSIDEASKYFRESPKEGIEREQKLLDIYQPNIYQPTKDNARIVRLFLQENSREEFETLVNDVYRLHSRKSLVTLKLNLCKKSKDFIVVSGFAESPGFKPLVFDPGDS